MCNRGRLAAAILLALGACGKDDAPAPPRATDPAVEEARKLLAEAGFPGGKGFPKLEVLYNVDEYHKQIAARIQERWRTTLGIEVEIRNVEFPVFMAMVDRGEFDVARRGWIGEYSDPMAFLELMTGESGSNPTGWTSAEFDRLVAAAGDEADPARRAALLDEAERLLLDEAPLFPIYHYVAHNLIRPFIKGVHPNTRDMHPLQGVTLEGPGAPKDGVLIFNGGAEPRDADPARARDIAGLKILMHLYEGLVMPDPRDAKAAPALAERWEISPDGKTYTFHLREARWTNGDPVTAQDLVWSWRRVVDPKTASLYAHRMYEVAGAREIAQGKADPSTLGIRAVDDRTVEVRLVRRTPYFLDLMCLNIFYPVHRATVEKHGPKAFTDPAVMVTNGPYRLAEWKFKERKVFVKNPSWRAAGEVKLEKFVFIAVERAETAYTMYEGGQCHWLFRIPPAVIDLPREDHVRNPYNGVYFYIYNIRKKPLDDVRVRRALGLVVDRAEICRHIMRGGEIPATTFIPPTSRLK
jgi:ABC-type oligopeptide transport system substrate-binding subunit